MFVKVAIFSVTWLFITHYLMFLIETHYNAVCMLAFSCLHVYAVLHALIFACKA